MNSERRMDPSAESGPGCQDVNPQFLQQLRELDIPEEAAKQALLYTRNVSAEEAAMYYFNKLENEEEENEDLTFKMVFVVNMDPRPGCNCVAAQVGHGAGGLYQTLQEKTSWREMAWKWDHSGGKKGGASGHKLGSFAGAAGPGHEPKSADIPSPGCRRNPGGGRLPHCAGRDGGRKHSQQRHWQPQAALIAQPASGGGAEVLSAVLLYIHQRAVSAL
ncbi:unnamed protein product [Tetraodon nigroviridis]|uniref:peptidyl-tRNA hydrolase n=1 Tax=Tetraodon nigroviridis TaxID=99883 RepID=Q4T1S8_TETNG|nr:unnamed protein product [Tetraodon nigroviridis]